MDLLSGESQESLANGKIQKFYIACKRTYPFGREINKEAILERQADKAARNVKLLKYDAHYTPAVSGKQDLG
jgi:hypothetical protein